MILLSGVFCYYDTPVDNGKTRTELLDNYIHAYTVKKTNWIHKTNRPLTFCFL